MSNLRRIAKLETQLAQTRKRLAARNTECVLLLDQIVQLKEALAEHGLEVTFNESAFTDASQAFPLDSDPAPHAGASEA